MITTDTVFEAACRLQHTGTPYALVSVVKALAPASARPGDKAVVTADGDLHGWVGGGCAQPAVVRTVRQVLRDGRARLIRIAPSSEGSGERDLGDVLEFGMACHSGGTLELFVDPVLPRPRLVVIGASPVALSLAQLAPHVGFAVTSIAHGDAAATIDCDDVAVAAPQVPPGAWVVVATQGRRDVQALRLALALQARQVAFVASARKAQVLKASLLAAGADAEAVEAIVAPAGYPISATTPEEIALSVLAAVVSSRRSAMADAAGAVTTASAPNAPTPTPPTTAPTAPTSAASIAPSAAASPTFAAIAATATAEPPMPDPAAPAAVAVHACCGG